MLESINTSSQLGMQTARAIIIENKDPDKLGRVRVEYPLFAGNAADLPSEWCRLLLPYASKESGAWFVPEIGDEVVVCFETGNLDNPFIMGALYSPKRNPPTSGRKGDLNENDKNDLKFIKTRSGHTICFDDSSDKRSITIHDKENRRIEILSEEGKIVLSDEEDNHLCIEGTKVILTNKKKTELKIEDEMIHLRNAKSQTVELDGSNISIKNGSDSVEVKKGKVHVNASQVELGKAAMFSLVKGDLFQAYFNTHTHMTAWGPSSPPLIPMSPSLLSQNVKTS